MLPLLCLAAGLAQPEPGDYLYLPAILLTGLEAVIATGSDHSSVVSAQTGRGDEHRERRLLGHHLAQPTVGGHPTSEQDEPGTLFESGGNRLGYQHLNHCLLKAGGKVGHIVRPATLSQVQQSSLEPAEAEVVAALEPGPWQSSV